MQLRNDLNSLRDQFLHKNNSDGSSQLVNATNLHTPTGTTNSSSYYTRTNSSLAQSRGGELRRLRARDDRANRILASNKRRDNELADCMTELLATRALEASHVSWSVKGDAKQQQR